MWSESMSKVSNIFEWKFLGTRTSLILLKKHLCWYMETFCSWKLEISAENQQKILFFSTLTNNWMEVILSFCNVTGNKFRYLLPCWSISLPTNNIYQSYLWLKNCLTTSLLAPIFKLSEFYIPRGFYIPIFNQRELSFKKIKWKNILINN